MKTRQIIINTLSSILVTSIVIVPMIIDNAPFWACWGIGWIVWMVTKSMDWIKYK